MVPSDDAIDEIRRLNYFVIEKGKIHTVDCFCRITWGVSVLLDSDVHGLLCRYILKVEET